MYKDVTEMNLALCRALGLDPARITLINIIMEPGELPMVTVGYHHELIGEEFVRTIERYRLHPNDEGEQGADPPFPPHDPDYPDVNPATGDERATTTGPATDGPWDGPDDDPLDAA